MAASRARDFAYAIRKDDGHWCAELESNTTVTAESGATILSVNLPQVQAVRPGSGRIVHLHRNVPGVLARVNTLLADHGTNIEGQTLATRGDLGYVVLDVDGVVSTDLLDAMAALPETIRVDAR